MEIFRIVQLWCLFCMCFCQEGDITGTDTDLTNASISTGVWMSSPTNNDDNFTSPMTDIIITREDFRTSTGTTEENNSSDSVTTVTSLSTTDEEDYFSACEINPCKNDGLCIEDPFDSSVYSCNCSNGYNGARCGIKDECVTDEGTICRKGYCSYSEDRTLRKCSCFFGMFWDDTKKECRDRDPPCFPNPCQNGGECTIDGDKYKCKCSEGYEGPICSTENKCGQGDDCPGGRCEKKGLENVKVCTCNEGLYWNEMERHCEATKLPCIPNPCENHGLCEVLPTDDYTCNCSGYYLDRNCRTENICYGKDGNGTECGGRGTCILEENSSHCDCSEGYYWDFEMRTCLKKHPPCFPNPCQNDGLCSKSMQNIFNCTCSEEYTGELCQNPNFCVLQGGHALCGDATCESNSDLKTYQCRCKEGSYFDFNGRTCMDIDFCPIMTCGENEQCINSTCICEDNFKRNNMTNRCEANFCAASPCPVDDMICTEGKGVSDYYCSCRKGYSLNGIQCANAVCEFPSFNDCDQICLPAEEGYSCNCDLQHFILDDNNRTCIYSGNTTCTNKTCDMGKCFKEDDGEETCACPPGYTEENGKCTGSCQSNKMQEGVCPSDNCEISENGFRCKCEGKYKLSNDKVTCTIRRMCEKGEIGWNACSAKNAKCIEDWNSDAGYSCQCTFPQKETNMGQCQDICDNEEYQRNCSALNARCDIDTDGEIICKCPPLYQPTRNGVVCNQRADVSYLITIPLDLETYRIGHSRQVKRRRSLDTDRAADHFQIQYDAEKALSKVFPELNQLNIINCRENVDYYLCKMELQFVSITNEDLKRISLPDFCLSDQKSVEKCLIPPSLISRKNRLKIDLTIKKSDPCDIDVKEQLCGSETVCTSSGTEKNFNCTCDVGYEKRARNFPFVDSSSFVDVCNDINECLLDGVCPQHTTCKNLIGSYTCSCMPGYRIKDKSSDAKVDGCVEICNPSPCDHGNCEKTGDDEFVCRCEAGYTGILCDLTDSNFKRAQTNTIIVGAVLGGVLLVVIIIFYVTVQRIKKKKQDEPDQMIYATEMNERRGGAVNNAYQ